MDKQIKKAVEVFKSGGIVIFPTDTAFGIGCRMDNTESVRKVFKIRGRSKDKAVLVLVDSTDMAMKYLLPIDEEIKDLMKKYWPGGLTIISPCRKDKIPGIVRAYGKNLGVRMPDNTMIRAIITKIGVPIIAPSANLAGGITPYDQNSIDKKLLYKADFFLPGECKLKEQSTIIDCSSRPWRIIRKGAVNINL